MTLEERVSALESARGNAVYVDLNKESLYKAIMAHVRNDGTPHAHLPVIFVISGKQVVEETLPWYPGLCIVGYNTWPGVSELVRPDGKPLLSVPEWLRQGGGGSGIPYSHHSKFSNVRFSGHDRDAYALLEPYNGGFQCVFDQCHLTKNGGRGIEVDRTVMNLVFRDCDASGLDGGLAYFDLTGSTIGGFHWLRGQIDDVGAIPFEFKSYRKGGLPASLCQYVIDGVKWEHHDRERPARAFVWNHSGTAFNNINVIVRDTRANLNYTDDFAFVKETRSRANRPSMFSLQNIRVYAKGEGKLVQTLGDEDSGRKYADGAFGCDEPRVYGSNVWKRY